MNMVDQPADRASKYRIVSIRGGWRIQHGETSTGPFADPAEAIDQACRSARSDAARGRVAIVMAETAPRELHCYTPALEGQAAAAPGAPPHLRLIAHR
ncbi:MAG TPA: hypothetical protein VHY32_04440 [Caulobacteraceae bacterium]|nr:hypothetical protein [Caulobacteraceae bacterium]